MNQDINTVSRRRAFSVGEVCAQLGVSRSTIYRLWLDNSGPAYVTIGSRRRITEESLRAWLRNQAAFAVRAVDTGAARGGTNADARAPEAQEAAKPAKRQHVPITRRTPANEGHIRKASRKVKAQKRGSASR